LASDLGRAFDADGLRADFTAVAGTPWIEGRACWQAARTGAVAPAQMFVHAYQAGALESLVGAYVRVVCAHGIPRLQPGQRLAVRLDALPPSAPVLGAALAGLMEAGPPGAADRVVLVLAAPRDAQGASLGTELERLRDAGLLVGVDVTAAVARADIAPSGWLLAADYWRIDFDPQATRSEDQAGRLARLLDLARRRRIAVIAPPGLLA
jgi:hypothetical protein